MPYTARPRIFRAPSALGAAFGAALNTSTVASYPTVGSNSTARFLPNATRAPGLTAFPPQVVGSYANEGYRDDAAQDATNRVTYAGGTWTIRLRVYKNNGITQPDQDVQFSCYAYIVNASNVVQVIVFVAFSAVTTLVGNGNAQFVTMSATTGAPAALSPGDKLHVEVYVQTLTLGTVAAPALATTVTLFVDDPGTTTASMLTAQPDFTIQFARTQATVGVGGASVTRRLIGIARGIAPATLGALTISKRVTKPVSTVGDGAAMLVRKVGLPRSYAAVGAVTIPRKVAKALTMFGIGAASADRRVVAFRPVDAAGIGAASTARAIIARRVFAAASIGLASLDRRLLMRRGVAASAVGLVTVPRKVTKLVSATAIGAVSLAQRYFKVVTFTAIGAASVQRALVLRRTLEASARGALRIFAKLPIERIPGGSGGTITTVIRKIFPIFGD